jgi:endonuclease/exonuclease/phosphatase family metal-dependent hydrolase
LRSLKSVRGCILLGVLACAQATESQRAEPPPSAAREALTVTAITQAEGPAEPMSSGSFTALTYNVAGLPEVFSRSRPSVYMPQIGRRLNRYDLVLLQESWQTPSPNPAAPLRCYHELLVTTARHRYKTPAASQPFGTDLRRPSALLADGLNVFSKYPLLSTQRVAWEQCVNTFHDCYALKGFSMTPVQLALGLSLHVYNLHMEAGWSDADDAARDAAIDQLLAYIEVHSRGQALIVGGDFNLHGDRGRSAAQLTKLRDGAGLHDACVECEHPRNVDKVLYRGNEHIRLEADSWRLESSAFRSESGETLSDHAPLAVHFKWSTQAAD